MRLMNYETVSVRILIACIIPFAVIGYVFGEDQHAKPEAEKIAEKVSRKAKVSEKAEGNQDLVKDKVTVRSGNDGQPVVEQFGEAFISTAPVSTGRKRPRVKNLTKMIGPRPIRPYLWERKPL